MSTTAVPLQKSEVNPTVKQNIWETATLLIVSRKWPSLSKTISSTDIETKNADKKRIHVSKDLFNSKALKKLFSFDAKIDDFIGRRASSFPLKGGVFLLAKTLIHEVENEMIQHAAGRAPLIQACYEAYDNDLEEAKQSLGEYFDPNDYPTKEQFRHCFQFEWHYWNFAVDETLKQISAELAEREADKLVEKWVEAGKAAETVLYEGMNELVAHLMDRLSPGADKDGNPTKKTFRDSMLDNLTDFLKYIKVRNLTGNEDINKLADQAQALMNGVTPDLLRNNEAMRDNVLKGFTQIKTELDKSIIEGANRAVRFQD